MNKTGVRDIKSATMQSHSPLVVSVVYKSGGMDSFTPTQMDAELTPAAQAAVRKFIASPNLRSMILEASNLLDPNHQGLQWPDPIAWDGRPLAEQARDICAKLDAEEIAPDLSARLTDAASNA